MNGAINKFRPAVDTAGRFVYDLFFYLDTRLSGTLGLICGLQVLSKSNQDTQLSGTLGLIWDCKCHVKAIKIRS